MHFYKHICDPLRTSHVMCGQPLKEIEYWASACAPIGVTCPICLRVNFRRKNGIKPNENEMVLYTFVYSSRHKETINLIYPSKKNIVKTIFGKEFSCCYVDGYSCHFNDNIVHQMYYPYNMEYINSLISTSTMGK